MDSEPSAAAPSPPPSHPAASTHPLGCIPSLVLQPLPPPPCRIHSPAGLYSEPSAAASSPPPCRIHSPAGLYSEPGAAPQAPAAAALRPAHFLQLSHDGRELTVVHHTVIVQVHHVKDDFDILEGMGGEGGSAWAGREGGHGRGERAKGCSRLGFWPLQLHSLKTLPSLKTLKSFCPLAASSQPVRPPALQPLIAS